MERGLAVICTYTGFVPDEQLMEMTYVRYTNILSEIVKKLRYESISNLWGNSFAKDVNEVVDKYNPLTDLMGQSGGARRLTRSAINELKGINRV